jgi:diguanylate cyclase (GGDEF)-like protein
VMWESKLGTGAGLNQAASAEAVGLWFPTVMVEAASLDGAPSSMPIDGLVDAVDGLARTDAALETRGGRPEGQPPATWRTAERSLARVAPRSVDGAPSPANESAGQRAIDILTEVNLEASWATERGELRAAIAAHEDRLSQIRLRQLGGITVLCAMAIYLLMCAASAIHQSMRSFERALAEIDARNALVRLPVRGTNAIATVATAINRTIERVRLSRLELERRASHDSLTGLPNRAYALNLIQASIDRLAPGRVLAVCFVDLDRFKLVNDTFGHAAGDVVLESTAQRLLAVAPQGAVVSRLAGDEFAIIWPDLGDAEAARQVARRALAALRRPVELPDGMSTRHLGEGASIGLALHSPPITTTAEELLAAADTAMYEAKLQGRSQVCEFTDDIRAAVTGRLRLRADLSAAVTDPERWGLTVAYQPVIHVASRRLLGAEALVRWNHPELGPISPGEFIPIAEDARLVAPIGRFVMQHAAYTLADWNQRVRGLHISVNVSMLHLSEGTLLADVERSIDRADINPSGLWLELTESSVMGDPDRSRQQLSQLRDLGIGLSIDDFGTGYSSLAYLHELQATALKIDQSFVKRLLGPDAERAEQVIKIMIDLAHSLDLLVIAEGIEKPHQFEVLHRLGCDAAQGYLIGRPMAAAELAGRIEAISRQSSDARV